jgi:uncharacterized protein YjbI with pentapeptide repeats
MGEKQTTSSTQDQPVPAGYISWPDYWMAMGTPWRIEPDIAVERQQYLDDRRTVLPDIEKGTYPFRDIRLHRADVEWLLATHENGRGPVWWEEEKDKSFDRRRAGLDLRGADMRNLDLNGLPLTGLRGGLGPQEWRLVGPKERTWAATQLDGANLRRANLENGFLIWGQLDGAELYQARLDRAVLTDAHLEMASLRESHLEGAELSGAHLQGANLRDAHLEGTNIRGAHLDAGTALNRAILGSARHGFVSVADVSWGQTNLAVVKWEVVNMLGDERRARERKNGDGILKDGAIRLAEYESAVRANRQVSIALRNQGLNENADRFAYRAQILQRQVLRRQRKFLRYLGSNFLGLISGYGYRPARSFITYLLVVGAFAVTYYLLGNNVNPSLDPLSAVVFSITSFHGRGFAPGENVPLNNPLTVIAAGEAVIGLLIEITFIATFTQRFFAR